jgi:GNAT superfamily N-acetyltransferase
MVKRLQEHSHWKCWIAEQDRTAVGNLWAQLIEKIPNPTSEPEYHLYFTNFFVRENCRGKGIGSKLFTAALTWMRSKDVHAAILWPTERSRAFYERHGFTVTGDVMELKIW